MFTAVFAFSSVSGPLWGGLLVDTIGWRWIFFVIIPLGVGALLVTNVGLRLPFATRHRPIDWLGASLLVVASTALILVPIWGGTTFAWTSAPLALTAVIGVAVTVAFLAVERHAHEPILPPRLFADRTISMVFVMGFGLMFAVIAVATFMPLFFQVATGVSATESGLMLVPQTLGITVTATVAGRLVSRFGRYKWSLLAGPVVAATGLLLLSTIDADTSLIVVAPYLLLMGIGMGLMFPTLTLAVQNAADIADLGVATSTANFFRNMGAAFGAAIVGALVNARLGDALSARLPAGELDALGGAEGLVRSPEGVRDLPAELHDIVVEAVSVSVTSVLRWVAPVLAVLLIAGLLVRETPLRETSAVGSAPSAPPPPPTH